MFTKLIQRYRNRWHDAIAEVWLTTICTHLPPHGMPQQLCIAGPLRGGCADSGGAASGAGSAWVGDGYVFDAAGVAGLVNHLIWKAAFAAGGDRVWVWVWAPASCCQMPRNRRGPIPQTLLGGAVESMTKTRLGWMSGLQRERSATCTRFRIAQ